MIFSVSRGGFIGASAGAFVTSLGAVGTAGASFIVDTSGAAGVPSLIKGLADNGAGTIVAITSNVTTGTNYMVWTTAVQAWTAFQLNSGDVLNGVAWNGAVFCIVTLQSSVYTWDGTGAPTWTPRQGLDRSTLFNNVVAVGSTFVLFGITARDVDTIALSIDNGVTFSTMGMPIGMAAMNYVNGLAVASSPYGHAATSVDAKSWVPTSSLARYNASTLRCYYFNNLYFFWDASGGLRVSNDGGATWTFPGSTATVSVRSQASVAAFGKIIIAGLPFLYSTNLGVTWVNPKSFQGGATPGATIGDLAYSPTLGLVVGVGFVSYSRACVLTTPDGTAWTARFVANSLQGANGVGMAYASIVWAPATLGRVGMFVGCSLTNGRIITSTDGLAWSESSSGSESAMSQVCYNTALDLFCVVGELGYVATTRDPLSTSWTRRTCPNRARVQGVASLEANGFVAITAPSGLLYSPDGATWTCTLMPVSISTTNGVTVPIYYSATLGGVLIPAATAATYMFTNDGQTVTLCQGAGTGSLTYNNVRHDEVDDVLMCATDAGFVVMPRTYNPTTQFVLPVMPNTWIRAT